MGLENAMIAIGKTDQQWFEFLRDHTVLPRVNYWTPTPWNVRRLSPGDKFYFFLKAPIRKIGDFGSFETYENLKVNEAWTKFGFANGTASLLELVSRQKSYASVPGVDPDIGCIILRDPVFFDEANYVDPAAFGVPVPDAVVRFKYFPVAPLGISHPGAGGGSAFEPIGKAVADYRNGRQKARRGQNQFRKDILEAYGWTCCITGESCVEALEVAHIEPYVDERSNHIQNGLPLRADLHKLFDAGLLTIGMDYRTLVSSLASKSYLELTGKSVRMPLTKFQRPSSVALKLHGSVIFRA
ncbi:MAG: HNH endonuclease [Dehalococcoidia bacterium]|nr:HNH endonuclease [Dehalococcoidia bacterium]